MLKYEEYCTPEIGCDFTGTALSPNWTTFLLCRPNRMHNKCKDNDKENKGMKKHQAVASA
jgi:hypothetical protein